MRASLVCLALLCLAAIQASPCVVSKQGAALPGSLKRLYAEYPLVAAYIAAPYGTIQEALDECHAVFVNSTLEGEEDKLITKVTILIDEGTYDESKLTRRDDVDLLELISLPYAEGRQQRDLVRVRGENHQLSQHHYGLYMSGLFFETTQLGQPLFPGVFHLFGTFQVKHCTFRPMSQTVPVLRAWVGNGDWVSDNVVVDPINQSA
jgi:hypothetical protein